MTTSDDGVRLWVCGRLVVDDWTEHAVSDRRSSAPVPVTAGQRCEVRMEYYENGGGAEAKLQ